MIKSDSDEHSRLAAASQAIIDIDAKDQSVTPLPAAIAPRSFDEVLRIQALGAAKLSRVVAGWKVSLSQAGDVLFAPIFTDTTYQSSDRVPLSFTRPVLIETEVAFVLSRDIPSQARRLEEEEVRAAVGHVVVGFEIVQPRLGDPSTISMPSFLADCMGNQAYVMGGKTSFPTSIDLRYLPFAVQVNGQMVWEGAASHPLGDPFQPLVHLVNAVKGHLGGLRRGQFVTTGHLCGKPYTLTGPAVIDASTVFGAVKADIVRRSGR